MTASGAFCGGTPDTIDGSMNGDTKPPDSAPGCLGTGLVTNICLMPPPTTDVVISANRTINTAMVGGGNCDQIVAQPLGGPSMCMVVGKTISIATGIKLTAQGPNPLLLVAKDTLDVAGTIDVASHIMATNPGAGSDMTCAGNSGVNGTGGDGAGGGGSGGTFTTIGGNGGQGRNGGAGGTAIPVMTPGTLRGGCRGGNGGQGSGGGGAGNGGAGGGGVYIIGGTSISVGGTINASGGAGAGGFDGFNAGGGGGGGGSGGMIALDSPTITVSGSLFANGAGGGGGNGDQINQPGTAGSEPTAAATQANGGPGGGGGGGAGGKGYALSVNATNGNNGGAQYCGGGGGGGGAGVIKVFGGPSPSAIGGALSPPAT